MAQAAGLDGNRRPGRPGAEAAVAIPHFRPDVMVLDARLAEGSGDVPLEVVIADDIPSPRPGDGGRLLPRQVHVDQRAPGLPGLLRGLTAARTAVA